MSCTNTCLRRKRETTYLSVVLPGLKSIHFFFSFFKPETRNKRKDRDCPCEISLRADEIKLWLTNQSLVIVCTQANVKSKLD